MIELAVLGIVFLDLFDQFLEQLVQLGAVGDDAAADHGERGGAEEHRRTAVALLLLDVLLHRPDQFVEPSGWPA